MFKKWLLETILKVSEGFEHPAIKQLSQEVRVQLEKLQKFEKKVERNKVLWERVHRKNAEAAEREDWANKQSVLSEGSKPTGNPTPKKEAPHSSETMPKQKTPKPPATHLAQKREETRQLESPIDLQPIKETLAAMTGEAFKQFWVDYVNAI